MNRKIWILTSELGWKEIEKVFFDNPTAQEILEVIYGPKVDYRKNETEYDYYIDQIIDSQCKLMDRYWSLREYSE